MIVRDRASIQSEKQKNRWRMQNINSKERQELTDYAAKMTGLGDLDGFQKLEFSRLAENLLSAGLLNEAIFEHGARRYTALAKACLEANPLGVEQMLLAGALPEAGESESPLSALMSNKSAGEDDSPMRKAKYAGCLNALDSAKVNVNWRDSHGFTPAHWAAISRNSTNDLRWLFERGADARAAADSGCQPLHLASSAEAARLILLQGAEIDAVGAAGETPLLAAIRRRNVPLATFLVEQGADLFASRPTIADDGDNLGARIDILDLARARLSSAMCDGGPELLSKIKEGRRVAKEKAAIAEAARKQDNRQGISIAPLRL